jgi:hypothetical protein
MHLYVYENINCFEMKRSVQFILYLSVQFILNVNFL